MESRGGEVWRNRTDTRRYGRQGKREVIESFGLHPFIYTITPDNRLLAAYHNGPMNRAERKFVEERTGLALKRFHLDNPGGMAPFLPRTILYFAIGDAEATSAAAEALTRMGGCAVSSYMDNTVPGMGILEVFCLPVLTKELW